MHDETSHERQKVSRPKIVLLGLGLGLGARLELGYVRAIEAMLGYG